MTWSAPRDRTNLRFLVLDTPVTSAPSAFAICRAKVPTPPEAPLIRTRVPDWTLPTSRTALSAVRPDMTDAAASSNASPAGFLMSCDAGTTVNSANVPGMARVLPHEDPNTSSPGRRSVTFVPTASTTPATSVPRTGVRGRRSPDLSRTMYGTPVTVIQSGVFTLVACTRIRTSSSPTDGRSTSSTRSTRSGAPYVFWTMAFIAPPFSVAVVEVGGQRCEDGGQQGCGAERDGELEACDSSVHQRARGRGEMRDRADVDERLQLARQRLRFHEDVAEEHEREQGHGARVRDGVRRPHQQPDRGEEPRQSEGEDDHERDRHENAHDSGLRPVAQRHPEADDDARRHEVADAVPEHGADERRGSRDGQRAEAIDDALGDVRVESDARV